MIEGSASEVLKHVFRNLISIVQELRTYNHHSEFYARTFITGNQILTITPLSILRILLLQLQKKKQKTDATKRLLYRISQCQKKEVNVLRLQVPTETLHPSRQVEVEVAYASASYPYLTPVELISVCAWFIPFATRSLLGSFSSFESSWHRQLLSQSASSLGWPRCSYAHEPGTTGVVDKLGSTFSASRLSTDDLG